MRLQRRYGEPHIAICDACHIDYTTVRIRGVMLCGACSKHGEDSRQEFEEHEADVNPLREEVVILDPDGTLDDDE